MIDIDLKSLKDHIGRELAISDWLEISQDRMQKFADATGDDQWIHVDTARAAAESPYRTTIAHGFLTLSLLSLLARRAMIVKSSPMAINYGVNRVRFISAVPAGSRIRGRFSPRDVEEADGAVQVTWNATIELEGGKKPAAVAEWIVRYLT
jgi:acyl dehydratase